MTASTGKRAAQRAETLEERFKRLLVPRHPDECWPWPHCGTNGYGTVGYRYGRYYAHRTSYEVAHGPIPAGLHVLHRCDNPPCVNPAHLFLGTHADNMADAAAKGRTSRCGKVKGSDHPLAKLDAQKVREIRGSDEMGVTLARRYGVYPTLICRVRQRKSWAHVPD